MKTTRELFIFNLKRLRGRAKLTQAQLAEAIGMSPRGYQKYEQGESWPDPEGLDKLKSVLKEPVSSLFSNIDAQNQLLKLVGAPHSSLNDQKSIVAVSNEFFSRLEDLSRAQRHLVLAIVFDDPRYVSDLTLADFLESTTQLAKLVPHRVLR